MKKLLFKDGISTVPSDYASEQISLSHAINITNEGELRPYPPTHELFTLPANTVVQIIHKVNDISYYICTQDDTIKVFYLSSDNTITFLDFSIDISTFGELYSTEVIGNTIALLFSSGIRYMLFSDRTYKYLGLKPPHIEITFGLKSRLARSAEFTVGYKKGADDTSIHADSIDSVTDTLLAQANKFIAEKATDKGLYVFPFFVRYAYRLHDGTHIMHSAPILMLPSTYQGVKALAYGGITDGTPVTRICSFVHKLIIKNLKVDYTALNEWKDVVDSVDIFVTAPIYNYDSNGKVDKIVPFSSVTSTDAVSELDYGIYEPYSTQLTSAKHYFYDAYLDTRTFGAYPDDMKPEEDENLPEAEDALIPTSMFLLPRKDTKAIFDDIKSNPLFYQICSLKLKDSRLQGTFEVSGDTLSTIQLQPELQDDYNSNDLISSRYSYAYNNRLNIADITRELFSGYKAEAMSPYTRPSGSRPVYDIYTYINDIGGEKIVKSSSDLPIPLLGEYLYYPNAKAHKMIIIRRDEQAPSDNISYFDIEGSLMVSENPSTGLNEWCITLNTYPDVIPEIDITVNGYIDFSQIQGNRTYEVTLTPSMQTDKVFLSIPYVEGASPVAATFNVSTTSTTYLPYKVSFDYISGKIEYIYNPPSGTTSVYAWTEVKLEEHPTLNGAYYFSAFKDYAWKTDDIPTITPSEEPLIHIHNKIYVSDVDNPFRFPATAISTVGSGDIIGMASASQALSQGQYGEFPLYVFSTEGIWPLYLNEKGTYATKQAGPRDVCTSSKSITQTDTGVVFTSLQGLMCLRGNSVSLLSDSLVYPPFDISKLPHISEFISATTSFDITKDNISFLDYLKSAEIAYDYANSQLIVFNKDYTYLYLYSIPSKTWTCAEGQIKQSLNSYPDVKLVTADNKVITTGKKNSLFASRKGIIVSRPFGIHDDTYKTITHLQLRGKLPPSAENYIKCALYGTRDGANYCFINTGGHIIHQSHGSGYKYFILCISFDLPPNHTISCVDIAYKEKQTNKMR